MLREHKDAVELILELTRTHAVSMPPPGAPSPRALGVNDAVTAVPGLGASDFAAITGHGLGLSDDLAKVAAGRAWRHHAERLGISDWQSAKQLLAGHLAGHALHHHLERLYQKAVDEAPDSADPDDPVGGQLSGVAVHLDDAVHGLQAESLETRLAAYRFVEQSFRDFTADSRYAKALDTILTLLRRPVGSSEALTGYARLAFEVMHTPVAIDGYALRQAWIEVIGQHYLLLTREAVNTRTTLAAAMGSDPRFRKTDVVKWAGTTRPTLDKWIADS